MIRLKEVIGESRLITDEITGSIHVLYHHQLTIPLSTLMLYD